MNKEIKVDCQEHGIKAARLAVDQFSSMASTKKLAVKNAKAIKTSGNGEASPAVILKDAHLLDLSSSVTPRDV